MMTFIFGASRRKRTTSPLFGSCLPDARKLWSFSPPMITAHKICPLIFVTSVGNEMGILGCILKGQNNNQKVTDICHSRKI